MNEQTSHDEETDIREYLENAVAIMFDWKDNHEAYQEMYDTYQDRFEGFLGIQHIAVDAAIAFTVETLPYTAGEDYYWVEAIEEFAFKTFSSLQCGEVPTNDDLHLWAAGCIDKCKI